MTRRYALRDDQWERIKDLLPGRKETVAVTAKNNRLFVEAVLYSPLAGIRWRDLPERFGDFRSLQIGALFAITLSGWRDLPERFGDFRVVHTRLSRWQSAECGNGCLKP
jgi:transposase